jgi:hypothetical protein
MLRLASPDTGARGRTKLVYETIHKAARRGLEAGFSGLGISAETSPFNASNEINYLAFAEFSYSPETGFEEFCETTVAGLVGGIEPVKKFTSLLRDFEDLDKTKVLAEIDEYRSRFTGVTARRWDWLHNYVDLDGKLEL